MNAKFDEYSRIASKIVDELPEALDQLDRWIAHAEDANPTGSAGLASHLDSAESLRDGLAGLVDSPEIGSIMRSAEAEPNVRSVEPEPNVRSVEPEPNVQSVEPEPNIRSAEPQRDSNRLIQSMEGASESLRKLARSIADVPSAEDTWNVATVQKVADLADRFVESAEKS